VLGPSPVPTIVHCLARRDGTDEFYNLKVPVCLLTAVFVMSGAECSSCRSIDECYTVSLLYWSVSVNSCPSKLLGFKLGLGPGLGWPRG